LLTRRMTGPSNNSHSLKNLASNYGVTNPFLIYGVYLHREYVIDKLIAKSDNLRMLSKVGLMGWSLLHTIYAVGRRVISLGYKRITR
jgi:hypothetical protein